tara:strand:- start:211909 stop:212130 length:222 start_codon:yes stop_codon:yes gene_type:complete
MCNLHKVSSALKVVTLKGGKTLDLPKNAEVCDKCEGVKTVTNRSATSFGSVNGYAHAPSVTVECPKCSGNGYV